MTEEELPSGWAWATIADIASFISRGRAPRYTDDSGVPVINQRCIRWRGIDEQFLKFTEESAVASLRHEYILRTGDVLWNSTGTGTLGRAAIFSGLASERSAVVDTHVTVVRPNGYEPRLLHYWIMSPAIQDQIEEMQTGSTNQVELPRKTIEATGIPVPPANEQRRIVERIDELFSQIEAGEAALARAKRLLARYRQAVLKAAVTGELTRDWRERHQAEIEPATHLLTRIIQARREAWEKAELEKLKAKGKPPKDDNWKKKYKEPEHPDTTNLPKLPEGWVWASIEQVSHFVTSGSRGWKEFYSSEGAIFVRAQNIKTDALVLDDVAYVSVPHNSEGTRTKIDLNDVLITITGANVTRTALVDQPLQEAYVNQHIALVRPVEKQNAVFMHLSLIAEDHGRAQLLARAYGAGRPGLGLTDVEAVVIPVAPLGEAIEATEVCRAIISELNAAERDIAAEVRRAAALRQAILTAAFAGKLVPQDPADEPAASLLDQISAERLTTPNTKPRRGRPPKAAAIAAQ